MTTEQKILEYRIAEFSANIGKSLQELVREGWDEFSNSKERSFHTNKGHSYKGLFSSQDRFGGFAIHCAQYKVGQPVGTISDIPSDTKVGMESPPPGKQYVTVDLMAYIKENNVVCLNCGANATRLVTFLNELLSCSSVGKVEDLSLSRAMNISKLAVIEKFGVKAIDLDVLASQAIHHRLKKDNSSKLKRVIDSIGEITDYFIDDDALEEDIDNLSKEKFRVRIETLGFGRSGFHPILKNVNEVAKTIISDEEEDYESYTIHLGNNGGVIRSNEISARKRVPIESDGNSVNVTDAWKKMDAYMNELELTYIKGRRGND